MLRRGGRVAAAYSEEAVMNKIESCGIEVSARELVVAWERKKGGCGGLRTLLRDIGRCLEVTGLYGLDVMLVLSGQARLEVMVANIP